MFKHRVFHSRYNLSFLLVGGAWALVHGNIYRRDDHKDNCSWFRPPPGIVSQVNNISVLSSELANISEVMYEKETKFGKKSRYESTLSILALRQKVRLCFGYSLKGTIFSFSQTLVCLWIQSKAVPDNLLND